MWNCEELGIYEWINILSLILRVYRATKDGIKIQHVGPSNFTVLNNIIVYDENYYIQGEHNFSYSCHISLSCSMPWILLSFSVNVPIAVAFTAPVNFLNRELQLLEIGGFVLYFF